MSAQRRTTKNLFRRSMRFWRRQTPARKRIWLVFILCGTLAFLAWALYPSRYNRRNFAYYIAAPLPISSDDELEQVSDRSCFPFWRSLIAADFNRYNRESFPSEPNYARNFALGQFRSFLQRASFLRTKYECRALPEWHYLRVVDRDFSGGCRAVATSSPKRAVQEADLYQCFNSLIRYRIHIATYLSRSAPLSQISDLRVLSAKFYSTGLSNDAARAGELCDILERMRQIAPHNWEVAYALAQIRYIDLLLNRQNDKQRHQAELKWEDALSAAKSIDPANRGLTELRIYQYRYHNDLSGMRRLASLLSDEMPASYLGPYYLAWVEFLEGRRENSEQYLREALQRDPFSSRTRYALTELLTLGPDIPDAAVFNEEVGGFNIHYNISGTSATMSYGIGFQLWPWPLFRGARPNLETLLAIQSQKISVRSLDREALLLLLNIPATAPGREPATSSQRSRHILHGE